MIDTFNIQSFVQDVSYNFINILGRENSFIKTKASYYKNCTSAFEDGAEDIYFFEKSYRPDLDKDKDGIACEPFHGY